MFYGYVCQTDLGWLVFVKFYLFLTAVLCFCSASHFRKVENSFADLHMYLYLCKKTMAVFYKLPISEITRETELAVSITFTIPTDLHDFYTYLPGQYCTLKLTLDGEEIRRSYSIAEAPGKGTIKVVVKEIKNGVFSSFANRQLKVGQVLEVSKPEGQFFIETDVHQQRHYAAFVAGSGITPVMSMIESVLEKEPNSTFVLVYGNKSPKQTIFYEKLHALTLHHLGRLHVHYVFSEAKVEGALFGRIDASTVNFIVKNQYKNTSFDRFFVCGPEAMIQTVSSALKANSVADDAIAFELFFSAADAKSVQAEGATKITVLLDDEETTFEMSAKQTLLDAALKKGLDAPYSCQGGVCSSCLARITHGSAEMKKNSILTDSEIAEGLVLTCQAHATSSEIYVDFDDI